MLVAQSGLHLSRLESSRFKQPRAGWAALPVHYELLDSLEADCSVLRPDAPQGHDASSERILLNSKASTAEHP